MVPTQEPDSKAVMSTLVLGQSSITPAVEREAEAHVETDTIGEVEYGSRTEVDTLVDAHNLWVADKVF